MSCRPAPRTYSIYENLQAPGKYSSPQEVHNACGHRSKEGNEGGSEGPWKQRVRALRAPALQRARPPRGRAGLHAWTQWTPRAARGGGGGGGGAFRASADRIFTAARGQGLSPEPAPGELYAARHVVYAGKLKFAVHIPRTWRG